MTAVGDTGAVRRLTFGVRGPEGLLRDHVRGAVASSSRWPRRAARSWCCTGSRAHRRAAVEVAVLVVAAMRDRHAIRRVRTWCSRPRRRAVRPALERRLDSGDPRRYQRAPRRAPRPDATRTGSGAPLGVVLAVAPVLSSGPQVGFSNEYYGGAVAPARRGWTAWFFGSLDPGCSIAVDKPPLSLWLMGLSARVFGFSRSRAASEALCTLASVACLRHGPALGAAGGRAAAALRSR